MSKKLRPLPLILISGAGLILLRFIFPERDIHAVGFRALPDAIFTLALWILTWTIAIGAGRRISLAFFAHQSLSALEQFTVFSGLGLGVIGIGITVLGLAGLLSSLYIFLWLVICATAWGMDEITLKRPRIPKELPVIGILVAGGIILLMTIIRII